MRRLPLIVVVCLLAVSACGGKDSSPTTPGGGGTTTPPPTSASTFTLNGIVTESAPTTTVPIGGATVRIIDGAYAGKTTTTDAAGNFAISGLLNALNFEVSKAGYLTAAQGAVLNSAATVSVRMTPSPQLLTETFTGAISGGDATCASFGGDGIFTDKPCKRVVIPIHNTGAVQATLTWSPSSSADLDLSLFRVGSTTAIARSNGVTGAETVSSNVTGTSNYALHVTYYGGSNIASYTLTVVHPN